MIWPIFHHKTEDKEDAMGIFNWLVSKPADALTYLKKAIALENKGRFFDAYQILLEAVTIWGLKNPWLHNNLAWYAWELIKEDEELRSELALFALYHFNRALEQEPKNEQFRQNRYDFVQYCFDNEISLRKTSETLVIPYNFDDEEVWSLSEFIQDAIWRGFQCLVALRNYYLDNKAWCYVSTGFFLLLVGTGYVMTGWFKSLI